MFKHWYKNQHRAYKQKFPCNFNRNTFASNALQAEILTRVILCMGACNGRRCYIAISSPIGCAHTQNDTWLITHWGRVTYICVSNLTIIGSDNGLPPGRRHAIIWTNAGILLIEPLGTNFSEISIEIPTFSFKKMRLKVSSAKWRPFCLGLNVVIKCVLTYKTERT